MEVALRLAGRTSLRDLREPQRGRAGGGRACARTHPPQCPRRPAGGAAPSAHAPPRAGPAPSRRRGAAGGGSGPRFLSPGLRASSQRSPGPAELGRCRRRRRRDRRRPPGLAPPGTPRGGLAGVGSERGGLPAAPPSGPPPPASGPSRPSQPVAAGASGAWNAGTFCGAPNQRPGPPRAAGATSPHRASVAAFGSGTLPGLRRLHCFLPPDSLPPPLPRLSSLPDPGRAAIPLPLSGRPSSPSSRTQTSLYLTTRGPLRPSPPPWPHGPSGRPLMLPAARWPGPQCPERGECLAGREGRWASGCFPEGGGRRSLVPLLLQLPWRPHPSPTSLTPTSFPGSKSPGSPCQPDWEGSARGRYCLSSPTDLSQATPSLSSPHPLRGCWLEPGGRGSAWTRALGEWAVCHSLPRASLQVPRPAWF